VCGAAERAARFAVQLPWYRRPFVRDGALN